MDRQGSFQLVRNLFGSIAGGLSSLASLPFAKHKAPEALPAPSSPFTDFGPDADNISKLYPDMELSETRKRVKLSLDGMLGEKEGECSNDKQRMCNELTGVGELSRECSGENSDVCISPIRYNRVSHDAGAALNDGGLGAIGSVASQGGTKPLRTYDYTNSGGTAFGSAAFQVGKKLLHTIDDSGDVSQGVPHVGSVTLSTSYHSEIGSHGAKDILHVPVCSDEKVVNEDDEMVRDIMGDDSDNLASFKRTHVTRKGKEKRRVEHSMEEEEIPKKKVRFGKTVLDLSNDALSGFAATIPDMVAMPRKSPASPASKKRGRADEPEDRNERKLRALTLGEKPARADGKTSTIGVSGVLTRKRERADYEGTIKKSIDVEQLKLSKAVMVKNLPMNASRKAISNEFSQFGKIESMQLCPFFFHEEKSRKKLPSSGVINQSPNSQKAHIAYKDVRSAKAALAHNMKEFNGNILHVIAAAAHGTSNDIAASQDDNWSIVIRNTPVDVKEEELFQVFGSIGSLKLDVKAVRVMRDPNTGCSKGIAHVFFRTEGDVDCVLSSQQKLKLRDRVLHVSRASGKAPTEQRLTPPRQAKRPINVEAEESIGKEKQARLSSLTTEVITSSKEHGHQGRQMHRANKESSLGSEHIGVSVSVSHGYSTRQFVASVGQGKNLEDSSDAKRKREEKRQRGISRSKKIRRT